MIKRIIICTGLTILMSGCITINVTLEEKQPEGLQKENKEEIIYWF